MTTEEDFRSWARALVDEVANRLNAVIPSARVGSPSSLPDGYEAVYVHFRDAAVPQELCVWVFSSLSGGENNFRGYGDIIGVGLKHNANDELDAQAFRFRLIGSRFRWRKHRDERYAGFRLIEDAGTLRSMPVNRAAERVTDEIAAQLTRAKAVPTS